MVPIKVTAPLLLPLTQVPVVRLASVPDVGVEALEQFHTYVVCALVSVNENSKHAASIETTGDFPNMRKSRRAMRAVIVFKISG